MRPSVPVICKPPSATTLELGLQTQSQLTEISNEKRLGRIRSPFSIDNVAIFVDVEAKLLGSLYNHAELSVDPSLAAMRNSATASHLTYPRKFLQSTFSIVYRLHPFLGRRISTLQALLKWRQPWIELHNA